MSLVVDGFVRHRRVIPILFERPDQLGHVATVGDVEEVAHLRPHETTRHGSPVSGGRDDPRMTPQLLLDFESTHPRHTPTKEDAIRNDLGITEVRYYVLLARAALSRDGIAHDPITARRVREQGRGRMLR